MKTILCVLCLVLAGVAAQAQTWKQPLPVDSATHKVTYAAVVPVAGASQAELYSRARQWFATGFKSANDVLQMDDKPGGKLLGKGTTTTSYSVGKGVYSSNLSFTLLVSVKDGRYRYELTDLLQEVPAVTINGSYRPARNFPFENTFAVPGNFKKGQPTAGFTAMLQATHKDLSGLLQSLQQAMQDKKDSNW